MAELGPYGPSPLLAVAVSGGTDSLALALLADEWARRRSGSMIALIIDHGLRPEAADEARGTAALLSARSIESRIISLDLPPGPAVQARARAARHEALARAARDAGAVHLLFGHHQRDQLETATMRAMRGRRGLSGMAALSASRDVIILRPLLHLGPEVLRGFLRAKDCPWIEDPSNADCRFERVRMRALVKNGFGTGIDAVDRAGAARHEEMRVAASQLAGFAEIRPEGFALWRGTEIPPVILADLLRVVGGQDYAPNREAVARLAQGLHLATLGGVQVSKWRGAWLFAREPAACGPSVAARPGTLWDGRFRIIAAPESPGSGSFHFGALGRRAAAFRRFSDLPSLILQSLPVVYDCADIVAIPHLLYGAALTVTFNPPAPAAPLAFALHRFV